MNRRHLGIAALLPAAVLATALPAHAQTTSDTRASGEVVMRAQTVVKDTAPGAAPLRTLRSSTQKCAGTVAYSKTVSVKGTLVGQLKVYTTPFNGGTAIACFHHVGATKGKRLQTVVSIAAAKTLSAKAPAVQVTAYGNFISYAGPAALGGVKGNCVAAAGGVVYQGKLVSVESPVLCASAVKR